MVKNPETKLREKWMPKIKRLEGVHFDRIETDTVVGYPDNVGLVGGGIFCAIEDKRSEDHKSRGLQSYRLAMFRAFGGIATIGDDITYEEIYRLLVADKRCRKCNRLIVPWGIGRIA